MFIDIVIKNYVIVRATFITCQSLGPLAPHSSSSVFLSFTIVSFISLFVVIYKQIMIIKIHTYIYTLDTWLFYSYRQVCWLNRNYTNYLEE